ncbi:MAG TPA: alpha/beta hydrolase [Acidimicrobiales bacterium]|nr:alpha/beta hydrolase [Acidimicrobiales bacterium]
MDLTIDSDGVALKAHLACPPGAERQEALILCHGFPAEPQSARRSGEGYPELAEHLASETGAAVLAFAYRGCGQSAGDFSLQGWLADTRSAVDWVTAERGVSSVRLAGFSAGGSLAMCVGSSDARVRGVATFAAPPSFDAWSDDPRRFLEHCRAVGVIRDRAFPDDVAGWSAELSSVDPLACAAELGDRALLCVHGSEDDVVPVGSSRQLVDSANKQRQPGSDPAALRVLIGAGHRLRHDPRTIAVLIGWLLRQGNK